MHLGLFLVAAVLVGVGGGSVAWAGDSVDHGATPSGNVQVVGRFSNAEPSGIARLPDGRIVLSFPSSAQAHTGPKLAVWRDGVLTPFPSAADQAEFLSPLGMTVDAVGRLWVLDEGMIAGIGAPVRPALVGIDPKTNRVLGRIALTMPVARPDTHVNDVRVDCTHGAGCTAFISDTSLKTHPALIVVDLASGRTRRILMDHRSVSADPGFAMEVDGEVHRYDAVHPQMAIGGVDGLVLSRDGSKLYWSALSSRRLWSAPTAVLSDPRASEARIEASVRDEGEIGVADGMITAPDGSFFVTDIEHHAVIRRAPDGALSMVAHDPRLVAPDSLALDGNSLLLTVGQWSRLPVFHGGRDMQERPYLLVRIAPVTP